MNKKNHHLLAFTVAGVCFLLLTAIIAFLTSRKEALVAKTIADRVEAYEFTPDREQILIVQDGQLKRYTFATGAWEDLVTLQNADQDIPRTVYTAADGVFIVSDATEDTSVLVISSDTRREIPLYTQASLRRRPLDVQQDDYCNERIGNPDQFQEIGEYWVVTGKKGKQTAFAPDTCRQELKKYYTDEPFPLTQNPSFAYDGNFIDTDTTIEDTRDDIVITSRADASSFGDCSGFIGAVCPTSHEVLWHNKQFEMQGQVPHVGERLPYSRFMSNSDGTPVVPLSDGQLLLLQD